ncbi:MAG: 50S ribosomal protein L11 methyltransferase, partial [Bacillota bacterium]
MQYLEISISVPPELVEEVADICIACGSGGVSIEDPALIQSYLTQGQPDTVAPGLYEQMAALSGQPQVKAYLPCDAQLPERLHHLRQSLAELLPPGAGEVQVREV